MIETLIYKGGSFPYEDTDGISHPSKISYLTSFLGFCSCGDPENIAIWVKDKLKKETNEYTKSDKYNEADYFFLYWADNKGLTEHGSSIRFCWLTELGEEIIEDIEWCIENEKEHFL